MYCDTRKCQSTRSHYRDIDITTDMSEDETRPETEHKQTIGVLPEIINVIDIDIPISPFTAITSF